MTKLESILLEQTDKTDLLIKKDLKEYGKTSTSTRKEGLISGLLTLYSDIASYLEEYCEDRQKEKLEILRLMFKDEMYYIDELLKLQ